MQFLWPLHLLSGVLSVQLPGQLLTAGNPITSRQESSEQGFAFPLNLFMEHLSSRTPYSVWLMHRRTDLWGPDGMWCGPHLHACIELTCLASEFDPGRFLDSRLQKVFKNALFLICTRLLILSNPKYLIPNPYIFLPFNAGKYTIFTMAHQPEA